MTSIEWLMERYLSQNYDLTIVDFDRAKEMHRQEIIDSYSAGEDNIDNDGCTIGRNGKETYYQETFVSKGSDDHISDISKMVENDVEKSAVDFLISTFSHNDILDHKRIRSNKQLYNLYLRLKKQAKEMELKAKSTLYTEEQVRESMSKSVSILVGQEINLAQLKELTIQSLKQPKQ